MKKLILGTVILAAGLNADAQKTHNTYEKYGNTLNLGVGLGYYGYADQPMPVLHADYEIDVARSFTLAPFINFFSYSSNNYWGDPHNHYRYYNYTETVVPIGVKGSYYFDRLLGAGPNWDFYLAGSVGFTIRKTTWENGYYGSTTVDHGTGNLFLDLHVGSEYHLSRKAGLFLDLSTGVSTFGVGIHL